MTSKTKRTLALVDELAGVPDLRAAYPRVLVPHEAYAFMLRHVIWASGHEWQPQYTGMVFHMDYRFRR